MLIRLLLGFIILVQILFSSIPQNFLSEMGTRIGDKPHNYGSYDYRKAFLQGLVFVGLIIYHLFYHANNGLGMMDYVLLILLQGLFLLRLYCYSILGRHFTFNLGIRKDHELIKEGPYKYLIHPSYTAQVGHIILGLIYFKTPLWLFLPIVGLTLVKMFQRMLWEEGMMKQHFGKDYVNYCNNRHRLIPFVY